MGRLSLPAGRQVLSSTLLFMLRKIIVCLVMALIGFGVWAISPSLTGKENPADASWPFYWLVLTGAGFLAGLLAPNTEWSVLLGMWSGQFIATLVLPFNRTDWWGGPVFQACVSAVWNLVTSCLTIACAYGGTYMRNRRTGSPQN